MHVSSSPKLFPWRLCSTRLTQQANNTEVSLFNCKVPWCKSVIRCSLILPGPSFNQEPNDLQGQQGHGNNGRPLLPDPCWPQLQPGTERSPGPTKTEQQWTSVVAWSLLAPASIRNRTIPRWPLQAAWWSAVSRPSVVT